MYVLMKITFQVVYIEWVDLKSAWKILAFAGGLIKSLDHQDNVVGIKYKIFVDEERECGFKIAL